MNLEIRLEPYASPLPSPYPSAKVYIKLVHADGSTADELLTQSVMMNLESCLRLTDIDVWIRKHEPIDPGASGYCRQHDARLTPR